MKEIDKFEKINAQHKDGLVIQTKKTLKDLQILLHSSKKKEYSNEELRSFLNGHERKHFVRLINSVSNLTSIKNYIPCFIIESYCLHLIAHLAKEDRTDDDEIVREIDGLLKDLELRIDEMNVIIPLENIKLNYIESIKIGNAMLFNPDKVSEIFNNNPAIIKDISKGAFPTIHREIQNKVCACIKVKYDSQNIYNASIIKIDPIINLLRIYACFNPNIIFLSPINAPKIKIGISGRTTNANRTMVSFKQGKGWGARKEGIVYPELILDREFLDKLNQKFGYINNILCEDCNSLSPFEKQILIAVRWIGLGIDEDAGTDKIIKFAIALECLLLDKDDNSKANSLAKRCAYILGNNSKERKEKEKQVKYLYNLRSLIVHEGLSSMKDEDIYEFQNLAIECLLRLVEIGDKNSASKIRNTNDLIKLIHQKESDAIDQYLPNQPWL